MRVVLSHQCSRPEHRDHRARSNLVDNQTWPLRLSYDGHSQTHSNRTDPFAFLSHGGIWLREQAVPPPASRFAGCKPFASYDSTEAANHRRRPRGESARAPCRRSHPAAYPGCMPGSTDAYCRVQWMIETFPMAAETR